MSAFNCTLCVNHHSNGSWCSGLTSTNGNTTHMTPLPQEGSWDDYGEELGHVAPPDCDGNNFPQCCQFNINAHVAFEYGDGIVQSLACRAQGSQFILSEAVTIGGNAYGAICYRMTDTPTADRYFLCNPEGYNPPTGRYWFDYCTDWRTLPEVKILARSTEPIDILKFIPECV